MLNWMAYCTLLAAGLMVYQVHSYCQLYAKATGSNPPKRTRLTPMWIGLLMVLGGGTVAWMPSPFGLSIWSMASAGSIALTWPYLNFAPVLSAESHRHIQSRLEYLRAQLQRLEDRDRLDTVLTRVAHSENALGKITDRFDLILLTIENHLLLGANDQAERIITVFARHLRQTLYEGSMPFLPLSDTIDHIQTHFDLMNLLTAGRLSCDVDDGMLDDLTRSRHTATFVISDWAQRTLWPYFQLAERSLEPLGTSVLEMDIEGDELIISYAPPDSMYLPEGSHQKQITERFSLLGDPSAVPTKVSERVATALAV